MLRRLAGFKKDAPPPPKKNAPRCLLIALISLPLNDPRFPRRQGIGIFSSCRMGCLHDNSL
jgi:hypothetical protein